jgi:two-component system C4-dicarboxylate transport sensor histidine kinase DctB
LTNALQAQDEAGRSTEPIRVRVERQADRVRISVTDRGVGVPASLRQTLFDARVTTKSTGLGLGLCLSRQLMRVMGGELSLAPAPTEGACFVFDLPAA